MNEIKLDPIKDRDRIIAMGFDSVFEYEMCMKCDYTNLGGSLIDKKAKCNSLKLMENCLPYLYTHMLTDRIKRERGIIRGIGSHNRNGRGQE